MAKERKRLINEDMVSEIPPPMHHAVKPNGGGLMAGLETSHFKWPVKHCFAFQKFTGGRLLEGERLLVNICGKFKCNGLNYI